VNLRLRGLAAGMILLAGAPATAQLNLGASLTSDYRLRGYSLSHGRPAASARIGYDDASGLFADGTAIVFLAPDDKLQWMGGIVAVGYARRLPGGLSVDAGVLRAQFSRQSSLGREGGYTEIFAGLSGRALAARIAYSPDYYWRDTATLYGRVEATARPAPRWRLSGHVGALTRLSGAPRFAIARTQYDWRAGVTHALGPVELDASLSGGGPNRDYYGTQTHSKTALVGTVRVSF
jgi:uncharacterized protein (TIGR02001 family)